MLPFSHDEFIGLFAAYNEAIWPAQILAYLLGLLILTAVSRQRADCATDATA